MNLTLIGIATAVLIYLVGSFPSGLVIGKVFFKTDIREHGSGNLGGTNAVRVLGAKGGGVVYVLDILKGSLAMLIAFHMYDYTVLHPLVLAGFSLIGHVYPIFAGFKGGKAAATSGGIILIYAPIMFLILTIVFAVSLAIWRTVSLSSILTALGTTLIVWINPYHNPRYDLVAQIVFTMFTLLVVMKHIPNIKRIIAGEEPRIDSKKKKK